MTKKREPGCTCHQEEGDSECVVHDPPTCKRCGCEYTMEWPNTEPTTYCDACAHMSKTTKTARQRLREWRGDRMLTHVEDLIGIDATTLGKIEAGKYIPGEALKYRIHAATGIEVASWPMRESKRAAA